MKFSASDVSIVIPSYNSQKTIRRCLDSLLAQEEPPLEIIVVDSSDDETPELICREYPQVLLIRRIKRIFPGPGRNLGAKLARGSILAFLDSDCFTRCDWVQRIANRHTEGYQAVGGSLDVGDPNNSYAWAGHLMEFREFIPYGPARFVEHIPSCNMTYRKDVFLSNGGFPESYYPQEDLLFDYLLGLEGIKIFFDPALRIHHFCRDSMQGYLSHQHRIGRVTRCVLCKLNIKGSYLTRNQWVAYAISPVLGLVKTARTILCFGRHFPVLALRKPSIFLLIIMGVVWWSRGFSAGAIRGLSGIRGWDDPNEPIFSRITVAQKE